MAFNQQYYIYIITNRSKTLYVGVTSNITKRTFAHKHKLADGFTKKYNISKLVYYEITSDIYSALKREKQIKGWLRSKKIGLIENLNPKWNDLSENW